MVLDCRTCIASVSLRTPYSSLFELSEHPSCVFAIKGIVYLFKNDISLEKLEKN